MPRQARHEGGFSILELTVAMGIMMVITGTMFTLLNPTQGAFATQPEVSDLQQRLRIAQSTLSRDLLITGAGPYAGVQAQTTGGALSHFFPSVLPYRQGALNGDAPGQFFSDRITLFYVPTTSGGTTLNADLAPGAGVLQVYPETGCAGVNLCGFQQGGSVLVVDGTTGNFDTFTITNVDDFNKLITVNVPPDAAGTTFRANSLVVPVTDRTYYLNTTDPTNYQLMYYDGSAAAANQVPVVDHVVGLTFDYWGDSQPPQARVLGDPTSLTYGPAPATVGTANCVVKGDGTPLLPVLGDGSNPNTLVKLTAAQLADGDRWCPDDTTTNRWDADLLRIRKVGVRVRVEAGADSMRGPANLLGSDGRPVFTHAGTSQGLPRWLPDQEIYFQVSPRNLNLGR